MASVKVSMNMRKTLRDGFRPVRVEVIQNRKRAVRTLFSIDPRYWNNGRVKASHPEAAHLNMEITEELHRCRQKILEFDRQGVSYSAKDVLYAFYKESSLVDAIGEYASTVHYRNGRKYKNLADHISKFRPHATLNQVDVSFMDGLKKYFEKHPKINSKETVNRYLKFLKTVLRAQMAKGNFSDHMVLQYSTPMGRSHKERLSKEEFEAFKAVDSEFNLSRDCFCLMVYIRGIRIGDCLQLKKENVKDGRLIFDEQKTGKRQDIRLIDPAIEIIKRYKGRSEWYLLPILKQVPSDPKTNPRYQKHIEVATAMVNKDLKLITAMAGIKKKVTTHVARHTFATWADRSGLSSREIQNMLNHSSLAITENYLEQLRKSDELDDAADQVFS